MSIIALRATKPLILRDMWLSNNSDKKSCFKVKLGLSPEQKIQRVVGFGAFECKSPWKDAVRNCCGFGKGQIAVNSVLPAKTYALSPGRHWRTSAEMMKV